MYSYKIKKGGANCYYLVWVKHTDQDAGHYAIIKVLYINNTDYCYVVLNSSDRNRRYYYSNDLYHSVVYVMDQADLQNHTAKILGNLYQGAYFIASVKHKHSKPRHIIIGHVVDLEQMMYEVVSYNFKNLYYIYKDADFKLLNVFAKSVTI